MESQAFPHRRRHLRRLPAEAVQPVDEDGLEEPRGVYVPGSSEKDSERLASAEFQRPDKGNRGWSKNAWMDGQNNNLASIAYDVFREEERPPETFAWKSHEAGGAVNGASEKLHLR